MRTASPHDGRPYHPHLQGAEIRSGRHRGEDREDGFVEGEGSAPLLGGGWADVLLRDRQLRERNRLHGDVETEGSRRSSRGDVERIRRPGLIADACYSEAIHPRCRHRQVERPASVREGLTEHDLARASHHVERYKAIPDQRDLADPAERVVRKDRIRRQGHRRPDVPQPFFALPTSQAHEDGARAKGRSPPGAFRNAGYPLHLWFRQVGHVVTEGAAKRVKVSGSR